MKELLASLNHSDLVASLFVIVTGIILLNLVDKLYSMFLSRLGPATGEKGTAAQVIRGVSRGVILAGTIFSVLQINGIDVSSMLAGIGLVSAFVGLAVQDLLRDLIMGTRMLTDDFFQVGDVVQYGSFEGTVVSFDIRSTKIRSISDGRILTVCNRNISEISKFPREMGVSVSVSLPLSRDPEEIRESFRKAAEKISLEADVNSVSYSGLTEIVGRIGKYGLFVKTSPEKRAICKAKAFSILADQLRKDGLLNF